MCAGYVPGTVLGVGDPEGRHCRGCQCLTTACQYSSHTCSSFLLHDCHSAGGLSLPEGASLASAQEKPERPRSECPEEPNSTREGWAWVACASASLPLGGATLKYILQCCHEVRQCLAPLPKAVIHLLKHLPCLTFPPPIIVPKTTP